MNARVLPLDARIEDAAHEGGGGAVEDRDLGPVDLDHGVVDAASGQRGHDMFDGRDGGPAITVEPRAKTALRHAVVARGDVGVPGRSMRRNHKPMFAAWGRMVIRVSRPVCRPTPLKLTSDLIVACMSKPAVPLSPCRGLSRIRDDLVPGPPIDHAPAIFRGKHPPGVPGRFPSITGYLGGPKQTIQRL
jgi:hypothetical protein